MEISKTPSSNVSPVSNKVVWAGRILQYLCMLFLVFDAIMKIIRESHAVQGSVELGWPDHAIMGLGIVLLVCTLLYAIPTTAIFGALLLTGYLGGAVSIMFRADKPFLFPLLFGVFLWGSLWLRDERLRTMIPFRRR